MVRTKSTTFIQTDKHTERELQRIFGVWRILGEPGFSKDLSKGVRGCRPLYKQALFWCFFMDSYLHSMYKSSLFTFLCEPLWVAVVVRDTESVLRKCRTLHTSNVFWHWSAQTKSTHPKRWDVDLLLEGHAEDPKATFGSTIHFILKTWTHDRMTN